MKKKMNWIWPAIPAVMLLLLWWKPLAQALSSLIRWPAHKFNFSVRPKMAAPLAVIVLIAIFLFLLKHLLVRYGASKWPGLIKRLAPLEEKEDNEKTPTKNSEKKLLIIAMAIILLYFAPQIMYGPDTHTKVFDVLDAWVPQVKVLAESGDAFSFNPSTTIPNLAGGLRLSGFTGGYNISVWLYMIFPPYIAYLLNLLIIAFTAFWGMALLLKFFIIKQQDYNLLIVGSALCFALLTFYPPAGLSVAGMPLLLYFFLKIRNGDKGGRNFIFIAIFPFYSLLHHAGIFIMIILGIIFLAHLIKQKKFNNRYFSALVLLGVFFIFTHFHLIYSMLDPGFDSYRNEISIVGLPFAQCFKATIHNFTQDRTNIVSGQQTFILLAAALSMLAALFSRRNPTGRHLTVFILLALGNAFLWGFKYWEPVMPLRDKFPMLNAFNAARFFWLTPVIWGIVFALSLLLLSRLKYGKILVPLLLLGQLGFLFTAYSPAYRSVLQLGN